MKKMLLLGSLVLAGCGSTSRHEIDLARVGAFKNFRWDGTIRVRNTSQGILDAPGIDRIELGSQDGRTILIVTEGQRVRAYVEVKVQGVDPSEMSEEQDARMQPVDVYERR